MAFQRKRVLLLAADVELTREVFGSESHAQVSVRVVFDKGWIWRDFVTAHRNHTHRFGSTRKNAIGRSRYDAIRCKCDRLQSRRTESIQGHRRDRIGQSGT